MGEYKGRIGVSKDTMLFVTNCVLNNNIKESTTKEDILKIVPQLYKESDSIEIIKLLPYESYLTLEKLIKYVEKNKSADVKKFVYNEEYKGTWYLEEAMIVIRRARYQDYLYNVNSNVLDEISKIFTEENKKVAEKYGKIEKLTMGMLYSYGAVQYDFLRKQLSKYLKEVISKEELEDLYFKRLNFNLDVKIIDMDWGNGNIEEFVTYIDDEECDSGYIISEQKYRGLNYKVFSEKEVLEREEYLWDERTQKFYKFLKKYNKNLWEFTFKKIVKLNEFGEDIFKILNSECEFEDELDLKNFINEFMSWYNNSPQYILCGYSPEEFIKK